MDKTKILYVFLGAFLLFNLRWLLFSVGNIINIIFLKSTNSLDNYPLIYTSGMILSLLFLLGMFYLMVKKMRLNIFLFSTLLLSIGVIFLWPATNSMEAEQLSYHIIENDEFFNTWSSFSWYRMFPEYITYLAIAIGLILPLYKNNEEAKGTVGW